MPFSLLGDCSQQELELKNYDTLVTNNYANIHNGHWTYIWHKSLNTMDIQITMYIWVLTHKHKHTQTQRETN
jgi:hypothetical protein